jgi:hypothetical protein
MEVFAWYEHETSWKTPEKKRETWEDSIKIDLRELGHDDRR